jgi:7-cyano-7-deazaguanine synthase
MKAIVLSSGGVDSTTCVGLAVDKYGAENVSTVSVFYGQKHKKEVASARDVAKYYGLKHYEFDLSQIMKYSNCALLSSSTEDIKHKSYAEQIAEDGEGMVSTYVPFRNGLMLSTVAALAMSIYPEDETVIYYGAHADDAAGNAYADCSEAFAEAMNKAINIGTYEKVHVEAPFVGINKAGVVKIGLELNVPYELTWSCYEGGEKQCGVCGTCIDRKAAFAANGVKDPVPYER